MLSHRRRSLLTLASYGTWDFDTTSFPYVYNSLLTKGSEVVKGKIAKIYANGVIENQLVQNGNFESTSYWSANSGAGSFSTISVSSNVLTQTFSSTPDATYKNGIISNSYFNFYQSHYYLAHCRFRASKSCSLRVYNEATGYMGTLSVSANTWVSYNFIKQATSTKTSTYIFVAITDGTIFGNGDTLEFAEVEFIDLTIREGTGNEPTTLTDNRIQNLLNRGYIAYNQGEYKGTNVGEIATEPYNLFDGELEVGTLNNGQPVSNNQFLRTTNFIKVEPNTSYTIKTNALPFNRYFFEEYDENKNFIVEGGNSSGVFTTRNNTKYFKFLIYGGGSSYNEVPTNQTYLYLTSAGDLGFKKHKPSASIPFIYQGNGVGTSHDTFEITSSEYVFTKNVSSVDLGTLSWTLQSNYSANTFETYISDMFSFGQNGNVFNGMLCSKYSVGSNVDTISKDKVIGTYLKYIRIRDTNYTSSTDFKTAMAGVSLYYELATPQTISIPRKHLGIAKIRDLSWYYQNGTFRPSNLTNAKQPSGYGIIPNAYCCPFMTVSNQTIDSGANLSFSITDSSSVYVIRFRDTSITTTDDFINKYGDYYIFYETDDEVDDIATRIFTENGGSVTTNSEVLPNLDLDLPVKV